MLRKARNKCREPAEVPFRACYSGPLRGPYPASSAPTTYRSRERTGNFTQRGSGNFFIRLNSHAMFNEDPLRSQAGVGAGG